MFSCEFCEIYKNTFSYRTTPMAASASFSLGMNSLSHIVGNSVYSSSKFGCQTGKNFLVDLKILLTKITCCHKT